VIADAAHIENAAVLTRNTRDFALTPVRLLTY
jgi:predicted nucleic acid-binding protein